LIARAGYTFGIFNVIEYKGEIRGYNVGLDIFLTYLRKAKHVYDDVVLRDIRYLPIRKGLKQCARIARPS
jgi:hypothetical protein